MAAHACVCGCTRETDARCCLNVLMLVPVLGGEDPLVCRLRVRGQRRMRRNQHSPLQNNPNISSFSRHLLAKLILSSVRLRHSVMVLVYVLNVLFN